MRSKFHRRSLGLLGATAVIAIAATVTAVYALAGHQASGVQSYTGCLTTSSGTVMKLAVGDSPSSPCSSAQVQVHMSGGDITAVNAGSGLTGGGTNGAVSLGVDFAGSGTATTAARSDHTHDAADVVSGTFDLARIPQGSGSGLDADTLDGLDSSAFLSGNRMPTSGFVEVQPGQSYTLLSTNEVALIGVCQASPFTAEVDVASTAGPFGVFSTQSTSLGNLGGAVLTGSPVAIASTSGSPLVDGGRFNLVGTNGGALNGTFLEYLGGGTCNFETTAITDNVGIIPASTSAHAPTIKQPSAP